MKCPHCNKPDFIPAVVITHTKVYGGGSKNFNCVHCNQVVSALCSLRVIIDNVKKTDRESDWG